MTAEPAGDAGDAEPADELGPDAGDVESAASAGTTPPAGDAGGVEPVDDVGNIGDVGSALTAVRSNVRQLLADLPRRPSRLRIHAGDVEIEAEWRDAPAAPAAAAGAAGVAVAEAVVPVTAMAVPGAMAPTGGRPAAAGGPEMTAPPHRYVRAPSAGCFYRAPEPGAPPFVEEGDTVVAGQQVAIVEAMKLMIPVTAETDGRIGEVLKADGDNVDHDDPLFTLLPLSP